MFWHSKNSEVKKNWKVKSRLLVNLDQKSSPAKLMFMMSCSFIILMVPGRAACHAPYEDVMGVLAILTTSPYFLFFCRFVLMKHFLLIDNVSMTISSRQPFELWPRTYDGYSALHTQNSMYLNGESWVWRVNPECRVLSIHHKFWVQALNLWWFLSTLHFKLQHQIHVFEWGILKCGRIHIIRSGIKYMKCWVWSAEYPS